MNSLPDKVKAILQKKAFAHLATLMPDGSPQVSPVWVDIQGETILVNTARGRRKDANLRDDARVALSVIDPDNPYSAIMIRGHVVEATTNGANQQIDAMAKKYLGKDKYPYSQPGEIRVLYKIHADRVSVTG